MDIGLFSLRGSSPPVPLGCVRAEREERARAGAGGSDEGGAPGARLRNRMKPGFQGARRRWNPGFMALRAGPEGALLGVLGGGFAVRGLLGGDARGSVGGRGGGPFHGG